MANDYSERIDRVVTKVTRNAHNNRATSVVSRARNRRKPVQHRCAPDTTRNTQKKHVAIACVRADKRVRARV